MRTMHLWQCCSEYWSFEWVWCLRCLRAIRRGSKWSISSWFLSHVWLLHCVFVQALGDSEKTCFFPQIDALQKLDEYYPTAFFILNIRDPHRWLQAVNRWNNMRDRLVGCNISSLPAGVGAEDSQMIKWYTDHISMIMNFVQRHRTHKLVVIDIESDTAGPFLSRQFPFVSTTCWTHSNPSWRNCFIVIVIIIIWL